MFTNVYVYVTAMVKGKEALIWGGKGAGYGRGRIEHK